MLQILFFIKKTCVIIINITRCFKVRNLRGNFFINLNNSLPLFSLFNIFKYVRCLITVTNLFRLTTSCKVVFIRINIQYEISFLAWLYPPCHCKFNARWFIDILLALNISICIKFFRSNKFFEKKYKSIGSSFLNYNQGFSNVK